MENKKNDTLERIRKPDTMPIYSSDGYNDEDIPQVDLPQDSGQNSSQDSQDSSQNDASDVIPDEVPRKDGPGGEGGGDQ